MGSGMKYTKRLMIISSIFTLVSLNCILTSSFPKLAKPVPTATIFVPTAIVIPEITIEPTIIVSADSTTITFTEADVVGWINSFKESNPDYAIQDPTVKLDGGICTMTGKIKSGFISGDVNLSFTITVSDDGTPVVSIQTMQIGGMDLPSSIKGQFDQVVNQQISTSLSAGMNGKTIKAITIDNGLISIQTTN
jgi:hypothetical protein